MTQPPFPFVLVALTGLFVWLAVTSDDGWLPVAAGVGALVTGGAALYQSRPARDLEDDEPADDPWDERPPGEGPVR